MCKNVSAETFVATHNELGRLGEEITEVFLLKRGFEILARNYRRPWGELDIVAIYKDIIHFVEVKSVSCEIETSTAGGGKSFIGKDTYRPEDNLHKNKISRLKRIIQTYLAINVSTETSWIFDIATVFIDKGKKRARVKFIENIIL